MLPLKSNCSALQLAYQRGMITLGERERVFKVMTNLGLALWHDVCDDHDMLWQVCCTNSCCCHPQGNHGYMRDLCTMGDYGLNAQFSAAFAADC